MGCRRKRGSGREQGVCFHLVIFSHCSQSTVCKACGGKCQRRDFVVEYLLESLSLRFHTQIGEESYCSCSGGKSQFNLKTSREELFKAASDYENVHRVLTAAKIIP